MRNLRNLRKICSVALMSAALLMLSGCADWDIIGIGAVQSFEEVIARGEVSGSGADVDVWTILFGVNDTGIAEASFSWRKDFSAERPPSGYDVEMSINMEEFFPNDDTIRALTIGANFVERNIPAFEGEITPIDSFRQLVRYHPQMIGYHEHGHHYIIHFGETGHQLMFARDVATQEVGIMLMLNPQPFIDAGVDVHSIEGWRFTEHHTKTTEGRMVTKDFLVQTFDIR